MKLPVGNFTKGTVVMVDYPYRDDINTYKTRPAIVMSYNEEITNVILLQVTSHLPRTIYDYTISDYIDTGLTIQPSVVRCNCVFTIPNSKLLQKIGNLSRKDLYSVSLLFDQAVKENVVERYND